MSKQPNSNMTARVERAAGKVLARDGMITYPELFIEMGILDKRDLEQWYKGRVPFLEKVIRSNLTKLARLQTAVRRYGLDHGLKRSRVPAVGFSQMSDLKRRERDLGSPGRERFRELMVWKRWAMA